METSKENLKLNLGKKFCLRFGEYKVMSHFADDSVYIENIFGEQKETFIEAYYKLLEAKEMGAKIDEDIFIICVCGRRVKGKFKQLEKIVKNIN